MFSRTAVHILNTTPEQRKPQRSYHIALGIVGLIALAIVWSVLL
jgi:hypothetical protein